MSGLLCYSLAVPKEEIFYISWTIDAYEGLGFLRTDDASQGIVSLFFPAEVSAQIEEILDAFEEEGIEIERRGIS